MRRASQRGVTLMEVLIAVTLLALLSVAMLAAMRIGLDAISKTDRKLMDNRRVAGAQRIIEQEIEGFTPTIALCASAPGGSATAVPFFQGEPANMRFLSTFSLQMGWRGQPQILELAVIPGEEQRGVRLIVNEIPYSPQTLNTLCLGRATDPVTGAGRPLFRPVEAGPSSFVLADKLAYCRFVFQEPATPPLFVERWVPRYELARWPAGVRIEMAPLEPNPARLQPVAITVPLHITRSLEIQYVDQQQ